MQDAISKKLKKHLVKIKAKFKVKEIGIFGSQIKGEATKRSDIDILVDFQEGYKTFDNYMELRFFLEDLLNCEIDLVLKSALKERVKPYILSEVIYV